MNYKLIIVDDEKVIRDGMANLVDWNSMGFTVVRAYSDGKDVIKYIENNQQVDIILADIKMTFVSGLELAKYIHDNKCNAKIVLISGFKEFEYAKKAIDYGVLHYLTKPMSLEEIAKTFSTIKNELDKEFEKLNNIEEEVSRFEEVRPLLIQQFFTDLVLGGLIERNLIMDRLQLIKLDIDPDTTYCCTIDVLIKKNTIGKWKYDKNQFFAAISNFIQGEHNHIQFYTIYNQEEIIKIIGLSSYYDDTQKFQESVTIHLKSIMKTINSMLSVDMDIDISGVYKTILDITKHDRLVKKTHSYDNRNNGLPIGHSDYLKLMEQQKLMMSYVNIGNFEYVSNIMDSVMKELEDIDITYVKNFITDLFSRFFFNLHELGIDLYSINNGQVDYHKIMSMKSMMEIKSWCKQVLRDIMDIVSKYQQSSQAQIIQQAKEYINNNYNLDISLEQVADKVFLSSAYFSRLFKKIEGESFTDYLIKIRIEKAMELIKNPHFKTYEICEKVGYKNSRYFSKLFKRNTGLTPSEYRKKLIKVSGEEDEE
ncbi:response regulator transcription factor [Vallitalea guaymasensis]|uniref:Stage 0 sporulation protein A homolog n=1 Tax=Vallitalea guaymasensis TaxID=1185412 RepID=A0A8J8MEG8_9FIRM|nr:response regulator [Vallitalea guaymasensis]QUH31339.1 response regulator [Vallitalea guaymasensis]